MKRVFIPLIGDWFTKKHSRARRSLLAIPLTFFSLAAAGPYANAANPNSVCMPQPYSVPGLSGPPYFISVSTSASSTAGSTTLTFAAVPAGIDPLQFAFVQDTTNPLAIAPGTKVAATSPTTITISPPVPGGQTVGNGDTIIFSTIWDGNHNNDWINDPRWTGALSFGYVNGTAYDVNFRAVSLGTPPTLYLSWNMRVDPSTSTGSLYVGFFPEDNMTGNPTGTGYVIQVAANATTTCGVTCPTDSSTPGTPPYAPPVVQSPGPNRNFDVVLYQESAPNANTWTDVSGSPLYNTVLSNMRISKLPGNPYTWNMEMEIPTDSTNLLPGGNTKFLFWHDVELTTAAGPIDDYHWPRQATLCGSPPHPCYAYDPNVAVNLAPPDPFSASTQWGEIQLRQLNPVCPMANVVSLNDWQQVGSHNDPIPITDPAPADDEFRANGVTKFFAKPTNNWNAKIPAGDLNVTFRIADWGSTYDPNAPWTVLTGLKNVPTTLDIPAPTAADPHPAIDLTPPLASTTYDMTNPPSGSQQCQLRCDFLGGAGSVGTCNCPPGPPTKTADQCILVTLAGNVDFDSNSVRRNMTAKKASNFESNAQINIVGLPPLGTPTRDVFIFVEKQQMPGFPTIINGTPRPPAPVAVNETASTTMGEPVTIDLSAGASGNPTSAALVGMPAEGAVTGFSATTVTFTPATEFTGTATFQFTLANANGTSNTATATITVTSPNESPVLPERRPIPNQAEVPPAPTTSLDPSVQLTKLLPTYTLHVYHDTGRKGKVKGVDYPILEPQGSFGYFMQHQGLFFGWQTAIEAATPGLQITQIAPDFYKLSGVPDGGKVMIKTKIDAIDLTIWWIWLILLGIVLIILLLAWALRRLVYP